MSGYVRIASRSELPARGEAKEFAIGDKIICIANVDGAYAAMDNVCLHRGASLGQGTVQGGKVVCPWHGWRWDPVSGAASERPDLKVQIYSLRIDGNDVLIAP
ncbi:MAG: Rieske (2Fe-2S) protein [Terriglobales bacterium]